MEKNCREHWRLGLPCRLGPSLPEVGEAGGANAAPAQAHTDKASLGGIVFGADQPKSFALIPGYNAVAGAQLVPVDARRADHSLQFSLQTREIDDLVTRHRLDALVSDDQPAAFQGACLSGYPAVCEPLAEDTKLWFYGARGSRDALHALLRAYRQISAGGPGGH